VTGLDLFTGYAGITLALDGYVEPIAYVEIEKYAQQIIANRMADGPIPRAPILADVRNVEGKPGDCEIIYGGFPCQDISVAGLGKGLEGERSGLFFEILRLVREIKPTFIFLENVPAIRTRGAERVAKELACAGYDLRWCTLSAQEVGAPHKRERWFMLAANSDRINLRDKYWWSQWASRQNSNVIRDNGSKKSLADAESERSNQGRLPFGKKSKQSFADVDGEPLRGVLPWSSEPNVGRMVNGASFRVDRIKALGNGVVPLQVRTAFERLMGLTQ